MSKTVQCPALGVMVASNKIDQILIHIMYNQLFGLNNVSKSSTKCNEIFREKEPSLLLWHSILHVCIQQCRVSMEGHWFVSNMFSCYYHYKSFTPLERISIYFIDILNSFINPINHCDVLIRN